MVAGILALVSCGTKAPEGELVSLEYTVQGTMAGYQYEGRFSQGGDGGFVLTGMKETYGPLFRKKIGKVEVEQFRQIILEEKMYEYKSHYRPFFDVRDGTNWTFRARFSDGSTIFSHGMNAYPKGNGLKRVRELFTSLVIDP